jgi:hypothetical protein
LRRRWSGWLLFCWFIFSILIDRNNFLANIRVRRVNLHRIITNSDVNSEWIFFRRRLWLLSRSWSTRRNNVF